MEEHTSITSCKLEKEKSSPHDRCQASAASTAFDFWRIGWSRYVWSGLGAISEKEAKKGGGGGGGLAAGQGRERGGGGEGRPGPSCCQLAASS